MELLKYLKEIYSKQDKESLKITLNIQYIIYQYRFYMQIIIIKYISIDCIRR